MLERDLRPAVHAWLRSQGYTVIYEFLMCGYCDMVGVRFDERVGRAVPRAIDAMAVELKLRDVTGVIAQAEANRAVVRVSYAAMPAETVAKMPHRTLERFRQAGVGLLAVGADVESRIAPGQPLPDMTLRYFSRRWWNRIVRDKRLGRDNGPSGRD